MMTEIGESSGAKSSNYVWAKLIPLDSRSPDIDIRTNELVIASEIRPTSVERDEWCKIMRKSDSGYATIQNTSVREIRVDETIVKKEDAIDIKCGTEIVPGLGEGYLRYKFKIMPSPESGNHLLKILFDAEHAKCGICLNIWHDVVTVAPCLHNFCNGCFSVWLRRSQEKHAKVLCPQCRAVVQFVGRNHFLLNIQENILEADPSLKRSEEEIIVLNSSASIKSNLIITGGNKEKRKRVLSPRDEERDYIDHPCLQCGGSIGGFRCSPHTVHLQCQLCGGMMPSRTDILVPQHCMGCDRAFCGVYWHSQNVMRSSGSMCSHETLKPISQRNVTRIPFIVHEMNRHEQDITEQCIRQMGRTLQEVISEWVGKFNNRQIDRTRMPLNHADMITAATHVCNDCYDKLVAFLLYWFRISLPRHHLPPEARQREDCWYGYACRTQHHNEDHARKRNHVCSPTRGN